MITQVEHDIRGECCRCGHYEDEHDDAGPRECQGHVGNETCTCLGFRAARRTR